MSTRSTKQPSPRRRIRLPSGVGLAIFAGSIGAAVACVVPDSGEVTQVLAPDLAQYKTNVDGYLAKRCATLDCHGQVGRPLRLYSQYGLRAADAGVVDPFNVTGYHGSPTTDAEKEANYESVIGLQPEVMSQVVAQKGADAIGLGLLLLLKPLQFIPHKGGVEMNTGSGTGYSCVVDWLQGGIDPNFARNCADATEPP